jgi:hypothetical protein
LHALEIAGVSIPGRPALRVIETLMRIAVRERAQLLERFEALDRTGASRLKSRRNAQRYA